jgi:tetratricopeptide (TPR) repeat protein
VQVSTNIKKRRSARPALAVRDYAIIALVSAGIGAGVALMIAGRQPAVPQAMSTSPVRPDLVPPDVSSMPSAQGNVIFGNWNYDRRNWPHAIGHYEKAIALGVDNADLRTDLGSCYRFIGQPQKALEQYAIAQRQNPRHENSLFNTAALHIHSLNDPAKAAEVLRDFLNRFPQGHAAASARQLLAETESRSVNHSDIINWLEQVSSSPKKPNTP